MELDKYIREIVSDKTQKYYVFLDEIQKVPEIQNPCVDAPDAKISFVDDLLGLMKLKNVDLYVTGSNSRDILTEFKDRGDEVRVKPLTYREFYDACDGNKRHAWREFYTYGGMSLVLYSENKQRGTGIVHQPFLKTKKIKGTAYSCAFYY